MDLLNLDDLVGETRPVILGGKEYVIREQTLGQLITAAKAKHTLDGDPAEVLENLVQAARELLPDAPETEIRKLNFTQLNALIRYASATDKELEEAAVESEPKK